MSVGSSNSENSRHLMRGFYPFFGRPSDLAEATGQNLMDFGNHISGLIFSYPHGFDNDPIINAPRFDPNVLRYLERAGPGNPAAQRYLEEATKPLPKYLHLFNSEDALQEISITVEGVALKNIQIPGKKRISFILEG